MIKINQPVIYTNQSLVTYEKPFENVTGTISEKILFNHNNSNSRHQLRLKFDALASHDITYVGILQTAIASGLKHFPLPYILTNCHNSLCAVGGTINADDHAFGLSAATKFGGIYVPPHQAVIHQYMRETIASSGQMILGSDSHTRYGALGTLAIGEGGPELVKQILLKDYTIDMPPIVAVYLYGEIPDYVGPQDLALSIIKEVFNDGFVKNSIIEFIGPGIEQLSVEFRNGVDVMTTETTCLSSVWMTDEKVKDYFKCHHREASYKKLSPDEGAIYNKGLIIDLSKIEPMIALPFHPSNVHPLREVIAHPKKYMLSIEEEAKLLFPNLTEPLKLISKIEDQQLIVDQGIIAGCAGGTFENLAISADLIEQNHSHPNHFNLSIYPASQPVNFEANRQGINNTLIEFGAILKTAFCGPCFGAGDVPVHHGFSIRHTTRNFPNREGSRPVDEQISVVALMDTKSIIATAINGGILTSAEDLIYKKKDYAYLFNKNIYDRKVFNGIQSSQPATPLTIGPNIKAWPKLDAMPDHLVLNLAAVIDDAVTTTDELIPSGETSSYRSNPYKLSQFTLSRKAPDYVNIAKHIEAIEKKRRQSALILENLIDIDKSCIELLKKEYPLFENHYQFGTALYANKPGDGSAREQAASCQKVLGSWANIAKEYATKRYRSNLINWGIIPFEIADKTLTHMTFEKEDWLFIPNIKQMLQNHNHEIKAFIIRDDQISTVQLLLPNLTEEENRLLLSGGLINHTL